MFMTLIAAVAYVILALFPNGQTATSKEKFPDVDSCETRKVELAKQYPQILKMDCVEDKAQ